MPNSIVILLMFLLYMKSQLVFGDALLKHINEPK